MWYRADYNNNVDSEYFHCGSDDEAVEQALEKSNETYADIGLVECELVELYEVDYNTECFNGIRLVWG